MTVYRFDLLAKRLSTDGSTAPTATVSDLLSDTLYILVGTSVRGMHKAAVATATWRSKTFVFPSPLTFSWCKLDGNIEAGATVRMYADGVLIQTKTVTNKEPWRVKDVRARRWAIEIQSTDRITGVALTQSSEELP